MSASKIVSHPEAEVTVTIYKPLFNGVAFDMIIFWLLLVNAFGPDQLHDWPPSTSILMESAEQIEPLLWISTSSFSVTSIWILSIVEQLPDVTSYVILYIPATSALKIALDDIGFIISPPSLVHSNIALLSIGSTNICTNSFEHMLVLSVDKVNSSSFSTVIVWTAVAMFPQSSSMLYVLITSYEQPSVVISVTETVGFWSQISIPVKSNTSGIVSPAARFIVISAGAPIISGACPSVTYTVWLTVDMFPHTSSAVHVRTFV